MNDAPDEIVLVMDRLMPEEAYRKFAYDDATGKTLKAPMGNITIGYGCNLAPGWSKEFSLKVMKLQVLEAQEFLQGFQWYLKCNAVRRSVLLDITFNGGDQDILEYVHMIAAISANDWVRASKECTTSNPGLKGRYLALSGLLLTGQIEG